MSHPETSAYEDQKFNNLKEISTISNLKETDDSRETNRKAKLREADDSTVQTCLLVGLLVWCGVEVTILKPKKKAKKTLQNVEIFELGENSKISHSDFIEIVDEEIRVVKESTVLSSIRNQAKSKESIIFNKLKSEIERLKQSDIKFTSKVSRPSIYTIKKEAFISVKILDREFDFRQISEIGSKLHTIIQNRLNHNKISRKYIDRYIDLTIIKANDQEIINCIFSGDLPMRLTSTLYWNSEQIKEC
ncbi:Uncharacterized protein QTN25_001375 [Entamoeba marina]